VTFSTRAPLCCWVRTGRLPSSIRESYSRRRRPAVPFGRPAHLPVGPQQRLSASEALAGYTIAAAYATGDEHRAGRIRAGFRADLTNLAADPLTVSPSELPEVAVVATVVNEIVYHGADLVDAG